jgi:N-acetylmuramoyl-L-alanine amidase
MKKIFKVFIDAGHGGTDPGATGNGMRESDINLDVSLRLGKILTLAGIEVQYSRTTDTRPPERWQAANRFGADLLVSVHCNSFAIDTANGYETFYAAIKAADRNVAAIIHDEFIKATGLRNRGVKLDNQSQHATGLPILRSAKMPAVLVELAFISANPNLLDIKMLRDQRQLMAQALANGVFKYFGIKPEEVINLNYRTVQEMPEWARPGIQNLIDMNVLSGRTPDNLDLDENTVRMLLVVRRMFDRAGLLDTIAANSPKQ